MWFSSKAEHRTKNEQNRTATAGRKSCEAASLRMRGLEVYSIKDTRPNLMRYVGINSLFREDLACGDEGESFRAKLLNDRGQGFEGFYVILHVVHEHEASVTHAGKHVVHAVLRARGGIPVAAVMTTDEGHVDVGVHGVGECDERRAEEHGLHADHVADDVGGFHDLVANGLSGQFAHDGVGEGMVADLASLGKLPFQNGLFVRRNVLTDQKEGADNAFFLQDVKHCLRDVGGAVVKGQRN